MSRYTSVYLSEAAMNAGNRRRSDGKGWQDPVIVTPLPSAEELCASEYFTQLDEMHIYMDQRDEAEVRKLEEKTTKGHAARKLLEQMEVDAEVLKESHAESAPTTNGEDATYTVEEVRRHDEARAASEREAADRAHIASIPITHPIPASSISYYQDRPRATCLVYENGLCSVWDIEDGIDDMSGRDEDGLANPFNKAYIQHSPDKLKQINEKNRDASRKQLAPPRVETDEERKREIETRLLHSGKSGQGGLAHKYRRFESCVRLVRSLQSDPSLPLLMDTGCTYRNDTLIRILESKEVKASSGDSISKEEEELIKEKAMAEHGTYSWPCPPPAACSCMKQSDLMTSYCPEFNVESRVFPHSYTCMAVGVHTGSVPAAIRAMEERYTPEERQAMAQARQHHAVKEQIRANRGRESAGVSESVGVGGLLSGSVSGMNIRLADPKLFVAKPDLAHLSPDSQAAIQQTAESALRAMSSGNGEAAKAALDKLAGALGVSMPLLQLPDLASLPASVNSLAKLDALKKLMAQVTQQASEATGKASETRG